MRMRASTRVCMCEREREYVKVERKRKRQRESEYVQESLFSMELLLYPFGFFYCTKAERLYVNGVNTREKNKIGFTFGFRECTIITSRKGKCDYSMRKFLSK
jgi:hypothetical protein